MTLGVWSDGEGETGINYYKACMCDAGANLRSMDVKLGGIPIGSTHDGPPACMCCGVEWTLEPTAIYRRLAKRRRP